MCVYVALEAVQVRVAIQVCVRVRLLADKLIVLLGRVAVRCSSSIVQGRPRNGAAGTEGGELTGDKSKDGFSRNVHRLIFNQPKLDCVGQDAEITPKQTWSIAQSTASRSFCLHCCGLEHAAFRPARRSIVGRVGRGATIPSNGESKSGPYDGARVVQCRRRGFGIRMQNTGRRAVRRPLLGPASTALRHRPQRE